MINHPPARRQTGSGTDHRKTPVKPFHGATLRCSPQNQMPAPALASIISLVTWRGASWVLACQNVTFRRFSPAEYPNADALDPVVDVLDPVDWVADPNVWVKHVGVCVQNVAVWMKSVGFDALSLADRVRAGARSYVLDESKPSASVHGLNSGGMAASKLMGLS